MFANIDPSRIQDPELRERIESIKMQEAKVTEFLVKAKENSVSIKECKDISFLVDSAKQELKDATKPTLDRLRRDFETVDGIPGGQVRYAPELFDSYAVAAGRRYAQAEKKYNEAIKALDAIKKNGIYTKEEYEILNNYKKEFTGSIVLIIEQILSLVTPKLDVAP